MLGTIFGFEAYISDVENFPDYYDVLGVPYEAPTALMTEQMLLRIHELKLQEDEAMVQWREKLESVTPWLTPQEQWATPKAAKLASLLIEAHTILTDDSERKFIYNLGGHSALFFLRKACVRSQGFLFTPFVGFFASKHAVSYAGGLRCVVFLLLIIFTTLFARKIEIEFPTGGLAAEPIGIPSHSKEVGATWQSIFVPLYMVFVLLGVAVAYSFGQTFAHLHKTRTLYFIYKRTNFLRSIIPLFYFALCISCSLALQHTVGVRQQEVYFQQNTTFLVTSAEVTDDSHQVLTHYQTWLLALIPFWLLVMTSALIAFVHLVDTFVMPWTISREAAEERLHTKFFGHVHLSLQQERETFYWTDIPHTVGNVLHILVHSLDVIADVICPAVFVILLLSAFDEGNHGVLGPTYNLVFGDHSTSLDGSATSNSSSVNSALEEGLKELFEVDSPFETFPIWHRIFLVLHIRIGVWLLATLVNGWLEVFTSEERRRTLRNFTERCNYMDQREVLSELTYSDVRQSGTLNSINSKNQKPTKTVEKVSTYQKKFGIKSNYTRNKNVVSSPYKSSPTFFYHTVARRMLNVTLQAIIIAGSGSGFLYLLAQKLSDWDAMAFQWVCGPLFGILGIGFMSALVCAIYSVCVSRWTPLERYKRGDYKYWCEKLNPSDSGGADPNGNGQLEVTLSVSNKKGVNFSSVVQSPVANTRMSRTLRGSGYVLSSPPESLTVATAEPPNNVPLSHSSTVRLSHSMCLIPSSRPPLGLSPHATNLDAHFNPIISLTSARVDKIGTPMAHNKTANRARSHSLGDPAPRDPDLAELDAAIVRRRLGSESPASHHLGSPLSRTIHNE